MISQDLSSIISSPVVVDLKMHLSRVGRSKIQSNGNDKIKETTNAIVRIQKGSLIKKIKTLGQHFRLFWLGFAMSVSDMEVTWFIIFFNNYKE